MASADRARAPGRHGQKFGNIAGLALIVVGAAMVAIAADYPTMDMAVAVMAIMDERQN
jgi:fucose permease